MPRKKMMVEWDDGADLSRSRKRPGHYSPLTRDGDKRLGHVTLSDVDEGEEDTVADWPLDFDAYATNENASIREEEEPSALAEIMAEVVSHFIDMAVAEAKPHVKRWWNDQALPAIKSAKESTRNRLAKTQRAGRRARGAEAVTFVDSATEDSSKEVDAAPDAAPEEERAWISREEAQQRLIAALVARAFSDEQVRVLLSARIEDADGHLGLESSMEQFTPEGVDGHVKLMLEANPGLVDEFVELFWGQRVGDGVSLPQRSEALQEPPSRTAQQL